MLLSHPRQDAAQISGTGTWLLFLLAPGGAWKVEAAAREGREKRGSLPRTK